MPWLMKKAGKNGVEVNDCIPYGQEKEERVTRGLSLAGPCIRLSLKAEAAEISLRHLCSTIPFLLPWR